jgi:glyoxylase I family protein
MILGIDHASFTVSNMERTIAFYRDLLEMRVLWDSVQEGVEYKGPVCDRITGCPGTEQRVVYGAIGNSKIEFVQYTPPGKPLVDNRASDTGSAHVCFQTDNIMDLYEKLTATGTRIHCEPQGSGQRKVMYFRDPDGIILQATEGPPRVNPPVA